MKKLLLIIAVASLVNTGHITYGMEVPNVKKKSSEQQSLNEQLIDVVKANNTAKADSLLKQGAYINIEDDLDRTPLHIAVDNDSIKMVTLLLNNNPYILTLNYKGWTPLTTALSDKKHIKIRTLLLTEELMRLIESNFQYMDYSSPIFLIKELAKAGAINVKHLNDRTPLNMSVPKGNKEWINYLLKYGANVNIKDLNVAKKDEIKIILLAHTSPEEVKPIILALKKDKGKGGLAKNSVVQEKFKKAKQYLPKYDEEKLRQAIEDGVIQAIKRN